MSLKRHRTMTKKNKEELSKEQEGTLEEPLQDGAQVENTVDSDTQVEEPVTQETGTPAAAEEVLENETLENEINTLKEEVEEWKNKHLYLSAEFDNYRKRTIKEKAELILNGSEKAITAILPVLDDLERALANIKPDADAGAIMEGVGLIHDKFIRILSQMGVKVIETEGQELNTDYHEAVAVVPGAEDLKGRIIDTVETGYTLNDKVIRHAKVVVGN